MADIHSGAQPASTGAAVSAAVAGLAGQRGFGELMDVRHGRSRRNAAIGFGTVGGALVVAIPLDMKLQSMDALSASFSILHALYTACAFTIIGGLAIGIRSLVAGAQSYYRYAGGIVHLRKSGAQAIAWDEAARLEPVYQRRTQSDVGRVLGYRLHNRGGASILIPLAQVEGRDPFMDGVIDAARGRGLPVG